MVRKLVTGTLLLVKKVVYLISALLLFGELIGHILPVPGCLPPTKKKQQMPVFCMLIFKENILSSLKTIFLPLFQKLSEYPYNVMMK